MSVAGFSLVFEAESISGTGLWFGALLELTSGFTEQRVRNKALVFLLGFEDSFW